MRCTPTRTTCVLKTQVRLKVDIVFKYLDAFDPNKEEVEELKAHFYRRGGLGRWYGEKTS